MTEIQLRSLPAIPITPKNFAPFGQVITASEDGTPYGADDAQLSLDRGIPRFYIMRLHHRGLRFATITRHMQCTQCLGSLNGQPWMLGVAPPSSASQPDPDKIQAFQIPGTDSEVFHGQWPLPWRRRHRGPQHLLQQLQQWYLIFL